MNQSDRHQLPSTNIFRRCVSMKLHGKLIEHESSLRSFSAAAPQQGELKLTIHFGKGEVDLPGNNGKLLFGVKAGTLQIRIKHGKMPLEKMGLTVDLTIDNIEVGESRETYRETGASAMPILGATVKGSKKSGQTIKQNFHLVTLWDPKEDEPKWKFEALPGQIIEGTYQEIYLGRIQFDNSPCTVEALFSIRNQADLLIEWKDEGNIVSRIRNLTRNKEALLNILIFNKIRRGNSSLCLSESRILL